MLVTFGMVLDSRQSGLSIVETADLDFSRTIVWTLE